MRIQRIQPKVQQTVVLPDDFVRFLQDVDILIRRNDERTTLESGDLLQTAIAYGGLIKEGSGQFAFTYFPDKNSRSTWEIELSVSEIAEVASNRITTLSLWKCQSPSCRSLFASANNICFDCDYIDDEAAEKKSILDKLSVNQSQEDWVKEYLRYFPSAHPLMIIGDYNSHSELGEKWGFFSLASIEKLIEKVKR